MAATEDIFALVERTALERPEPEASTEPPRGIPADELERIRRWCAANRSSFVAKAAANDEVEIAVLGVIGSGWFSDGISAKSIKNTLDQHKNAKTIRVLIDSPGGDYFDGVAIMNQLKRHAAKVIVEVIGEASSAGSVIAMGADEIEMHQGTVMMVHRAWSCMCGNADELRTASSMLDRIDDGLASLYTARTGKDRKEIDALVAATTFMSPDEAVNLGFADRVVPAKKRPQKDPAASRSPRAQASNNIPPSPVARPENQPPNGEETPSMSQSMSQAAMNIVAIATLLGLSQEAAAAADENTIESEINKLKASARAGAEIEKLLGVSGDAAIGAVRALKESKTAHEQLAADLGKVKAQMARREFEAARDGGLKLSLIHI